MKPFFEVLAADPGSSARAGILHTDHGDIPTPAFSPVATRGAVKALGPVELASLGAQVLLANTYHLYLRPGTETIAAAGGLHRFMSWEKPLFTDSGGYQFYSIADLNTPGEEAVRFRSHLDGSEHRLRPEDVLEIQALIGADVVFPLDVCLPYPSDHDQAREAMERTLRWLKRSLAARGAVFRHHEHRQFLFGIVQGSAWEDLRRLAVENVAAEDPPGFALGGLAVGEPKEKLLDLTELCCGLLPPDKPRHLLGVGFPEDLIRCVARGVDTFDCVMPSRNARKGTLFTSAGRLVVKNAAYARDFSPPDPDCACPTCRRFSRAYLRHLFHVGEVLAMSLATVHNLYFYLDLMHSMRQAILSGRFGDFQRDFFAAYRMASD